MKVSVDIAMLNKGIDQVSRRLAAVSETVQRSGIGEVLTSIRKKMSHERASKKQGRPAVQVLHGRAIANFLAAKGNDPFRYPLRDLNLVQNHLAKGVDGAIDRADRTAKPQTRMVRKVLEDASKQLAAVAQREIRSGRLGQNTMGYRGKKVRLTRAGIGTALYGTPAPYGVLTGRFIAGILHRWRQGRVSE